MLLLSFHVLGTRNHFNCLRLASKDACHKRQSTTHHQDADDNVDRGRIAITEASDQQGTNDTASAPGRQHHTIDCTSILRAKEVGGEGWHCAETTTIAETDQRNRDVEQRQTT